ncbi:MAG: hypothetical protein M3P49_03385 [Actinomycetota bacterium]|nr:hypothetical protein [Actinomycetota bacterium]
MFDEELCATLASGGWTATCVSVHSEAETESDLAAVADRIRSEETAESRAKSKTPVDRIEVWFYVPGYEPVRRSGPFDVKPPPEQTGYADVYSGAEGMRSAYNDSAETEELISRMAETDYIEVLTRDELPYQNAEIPPEVTQGTTQEETTVEEEPPAQYAAPQETTYAGPPASTELAPQSGTGPEYEEIDRYPCEYFDLQTLCVTVQTDAVSEEELLDIARDVRRRDTINEVDRVFFYSPGTNAPIEGAQDDNLATGQVVAYKDRAVVKKAFPDSTEEELQASEEVGNVVSYAGSSTEEDAGQAPEEVLDNQYRLINAGFYDSAYDMFSEESRQKISREQYEDFFLGNDYAISDYSITSVNREGDEAVLEVELTTTSDAGQESYGVSQPLVREDGVWRVVVRDEQVATFTEAE